MDPQSKELLEKTYELEEKNNDMLRKIRSVQRQAAIFQTIKAIVVVGISVGAFYFLQPYIDEGQKFIKDTGMTVEKFKSLLPPK